VDEQALTSTSEPVIFKDSDGCWHVADAGRGVQYEHLTQNENAEKRRHPHVIGQFGMGLKDALAVFDRRGVGVVVRSAHADITTGRMIILPDDLPDYTDADGRPFDKDSFPLVEAVRMSMSYPFLFTPVVLHREGKPVYVVDGGLLSNFPIWLFDSPNPKRPTWGFRLHPGSDVEEGLPYRKIPRPLWAVPLLKAMFSAATEAWDRQQMAQVVSARTVSIPTHAISTTDFGLTKSEADSLYAWGVNAAHDFFTAPDQQAYLNSFGKTLAQPEAVAVGR